MVIIIVKCQSYNATLESTTAAAKIFPLKLFWCQNIYSQLALGYAVDSYSNLAVLWGKRFLSLYPSVLAVRSNVGQNNHVWKLILLYRQGKMTPRLELWLYFHSHNHTFILQLNSTALGDRLVRASALVAGGWRRAAEFSVKPRQSQQPFDAWSSELFCYQWSYPVFSYLGVP